MKPITANEELQAFWEFCEIIWPGLDPEIVCPVIICPHCGSTNPYFIATRLEFKCHACLGRFSPTSFNEFKGTKVPYTKLVRMVRLLWDGKNAHQIHAKAGVNYRTASLFSKRFMKAACIRSDRYFSVLNSSHG
jgi:transposase-like protein